MDFKDYQEIKKRMTMANKDGKCSLRCDECPLSIWNNGTRYACGTFELSYPEKSEKIVNKYDEEHPEPKIVEFTKSCLHNGDICVTRDGSVFIAIPDIDCLKSITGARSLNDNYNNDLIDKHNCKKGDIIDVYRPRKPFHCVYKEKIYSGGEHVFHRDERMKLTIEDIAKKYGAKVDDIVIVENKEDIK